jgi:hypothetical protein
MSKTAEHIDPCKHHRFAFYTAPIVLAMLLSNTPAGAQGLENLFNQATSTKTTTSEENNRLILDLQTKINERLAAITNRISNEPVDIPTDTLTVEDLDRLQREAVRSLRLQERRNAEYTAIREEIELLLFLQNSINELEQIRNALATNGTPQSENSTTAQNNTPVDVEALRAQWEAEQAAESAQAAAAAAAAAEAQEKASIPRLAAIKGAAGMWEAEIESVQGVMQYVTSGDPLADGFIVESINEKTVIIKATKSGTRYSLIPSPPLKETNSDQTRTMTTDNRAGTF